MEDVEIKNSLGFSFQCDLIFDLVMEEYFFGDTSRVISFTVDCPPNRFFTHVLTVIHITKSSRNLAAGDAL
jgi:hypothetical protein